MFDQKPEGVEDIFADTEKAGAPAGETPSVTPPPPIESRGGLFSGKLLWGILGAIVLVVLVGGGLYLALRGGNEASSVAGEPSVAPALEPVSAPAVAPVSTPEPVPVVAPDPGTTPTDTDSDGLPDSEEASAGTNPLKADTDGDGLSDGEEIRTYKTNPLAPDTDGDMFTDGGEVKAGYNPLGPGKL